MLQSVLARPAAYRAFGVLIGAPRAREIFTREHLRPKHGQRLLDIGCGTGDMVPCLSGIDYLGFDASPAYVRAARSLYPGMRFECDRIGARVAEPQSFDIVMANGVLHHLDDQEARQLLALAYASLRLGGRLVTLDGCFVAGQGHVASWMLHCDRGQHVRPEEAYLRLARDVFSDVVAKLREDLLRIPYTHLVMECVRT